MPDGRRAVGPRCVLVSVYGRGRDKSRVPGLSGRMVRIVLNGIGGAHGHTLWSAGDTRTLGAEVRVNHGGDVGFRDGLIGALGNAGSALCADIRINTFGHGVLSNSRNGVTRQNATAGFPGVVNPIVNARFSKCNDLRSGDRADSIDGVHARWQPPLYLMSTSPTNKS